MLQTRKQRDQKDTVLEEILSFYPLEFRLKIMMQEVSMTWKLFPIQPADVFIIQYPSGSFNSEQCYPLMEASALQQDHGPSGFCSDTRQSDLVVKALN